MVLALPLVIGLTGIAVDFYRVVQLRQNLDHRANLALVDASNEWAPSTLGGAEIDPNRITSVVAKTYNSVTAPWRSTTGPAALSCPPVAIQQVRGGPATPPDPCVGYLYVGTDSATAEEFMANFCQDDTAPGDTPRMELRLQETLNTTFLHVLGVPSLTVPVSADAVIQTGNC